MSMEKLQEAGAERTADIDDSRKKINDALSPAEKAPDRERSVTETRDTVTQIIQPPIPESATETMDTEEFIKGVLADPGAYDADRQNPGFAAIATLLEERFKDPAIRMTAYGFLANPQLELTPDAMILTKADQDSPKTDERNLIIQRKAELQIKEGELEDLKATLSAKIQLQAKRSDEKLDTSVRKLREKRINLQGQIANLKSALMYMQKQRLYTKPREILAAMFTFLDGKKATFDSIARQVEEAIEAKQSAIKGGVLKSPLGFIRPTLKDMLTKLTKDDRELNGISEAQMLLLAKAYKNQGRVSAWIREQSGEKSEKRPHVMGTVVPRLITYLEFALRDAGNCYLNRFSRNRTERLISYLKAERHEFVKEKAGEQIKSRGIEQKVDCMLAYFNELDSATVERTKIAQDLVVNHSRMRYGTRLLKAGVLTGAGLAVPVLGGLAAAGAAPTAVATTAGAAAPAWTGFLSSLGLYSALPTGIAAMLGYSVVKSEKGRKVLGAGLKRGGLGSALGTATMAGLSLATTAVTTPWILGAGAATGLLGALHPEVGKFFAKKENRTAIKNNGMALTRGVVKIGTGAAGTAISLWGKAFHTLATPWKIGTIWGLNRNGLAGAKA